MVLADNGREDEEVCKTIARRMNDHTMTVSVTPGKLYDISFRCFRALPSSVEKCRGWGMALCSVELSSPGPSFGCSLLGSSRQGWEVGSLSVKAVRLAMRMSERLKTSFVMPLTRLESE